MSGRQGLTIRLATADDAPAMLAIYAPVVRDTPISFELEPPSEAEFRQRVSDLLAWAPCLVACEGPSGDVVGYAYASRYHRRRAYDRTVEVTVYVHERARGRGVASALYATLLDALRLQGFHLAVAAIALPNPASVALHERFGFRRTGTLPEVGRKFDRWHDVGYWASSLSPSSSAGGSLSALRALSEVMQTPEWRALFPSGE